jgi:hypothetical protein
MFNSCNTLLPNLDWLGSALSCFMIPMLHVQVSNLTWHVDHVLFSSRTRINLNCHVLRVQVYQSCLDLDRTGYHAVDVGFWVVLELIIWWIRFRFNLIDLSSLIMLVPSSTEPDSAVLLYSAIPPRVEYAHDFYFKQRMLLAFHV